MTYEAVWRRYRIRLRGGVRLTYHGQAAVVAGTRGARVRLLLADNTVERFVDPDDPALAYPPPPRLRVKTSQGWQIHAATPHTPPVWPQQILCDHPLVKPPRLVEATRAVTCRVCRDRLPRFPGPRVHAPTLRSTNMESAQALQHALDLTAHRTSPMWQHLRSLFALAAEELAQVERMNARDPDRDATRTLPHPLTVQTVVLARSMRDAHEATHRLDDAHPAVHLLQAAREAQEWGTPLGDALAEVFTATEVTWPHVDGHTSAPSQVQMRSATHHAALVVLNKKEDAPR